MIKSERLITKPDKSLTKPVLSPRAYSKIFLHANKYPRQEINGVLLAEASTNVHECTRIVDAIPLFHHCVSFAPTLQIELNQIEVFCRNENLQMVGYYQTKEDDNSPDMIAYKIAENIDKNFPNALLLMVDIDTMEVECSKESALALYTLSENKWREGGGWQQIGRGFVME